MCVKHLSQSSYSIAISVDSGPVLRTAPGILCYFVALSPGGHSLMRDGCPPTPECQGGRLRGVISASRSQAPGAGPSDPSSPHDGGAGPEEAKGPALTLDMQGDGGPESQASSPRSPRKLLAGHFTILADG